MEWSPHPAPTSAFLAKNSLVKSCNNNRIFQFRMKLYPSQGLREKIQCRRCDPVGENVTWLGITLQKAH
jgi:hypothetical protein